MLIDDLDDKLPFGHKDCFGYEKQRAEGGKGNPKKSNQLEVGGNNLLGAELKLGESVANPKAILYDQNGEQIETVSENPEDENFIKVSVFYDQKDDKADEEKKSNLLGLGVPKALDSSNWAASGDGARSKSFLNTENRKK